MDAINARNYENEMKWKNIILISALLFIFISCIGMLGLVMLSIEQRTREIGVRRVLGAAPGKIFLHISTEFIGLIGIAFFIAAPAGFYVVDRWLQNFAYRTSIHWWMFVLAGFVIIVLALSIISYHVIKAAKSNPVKSLRME
jgi:putative ABC transport system permease protein